MMSLRPGLVTRVEPRERFLVVLVDVHELFEQLIVDGAVVRVRVVFAGDLDALRYLVERQKPEGDEGREGGASDVCQAWVLHPADAAVEDIGVYLAPERGVGAAA